MRSLLKILVCGGRDYRDRKTLNKFLDRYLDDKIVSTQIGCLIQGGAQGADALAKEWALQNSVQVVEFIANWEHQGRAAGPIRNEAMLHYGEPDLVVAFPGGRGTAHMIRIAKKARIPVHIVGE